MANFIQKAISRPGALTDAVGGKPSQHLAMVRRLASGAGGPLKQKEAQFYLNVLKPSASAAKVASRLKGK